MREWLDRLTLPDQAALIAKLPSYAKAVPPDGDNRTVGTPRAEKANVSVRLNLSKRHIAGCQNAMLRSARIGLENAAAMHYSEASNRWSGITPVLKRAWLGQYPEYSDCSSFVTWCGDDATRFLDLPDFMNNSAWRAGYTLTLIENGVGVPLDGMQLCDLIFYGPSAGDPSHVALYVGGGRVISHGSEIGPLLLPYNYRPDYVQQRRYLL